MKNSPTVMKSFSRTNSIIITRSKIMTEEQVIPLEEIGKMGTVKVYNQAYVDKLENEIADLEWQLQEVAKDNDYYQAENKRLEEQIEKMKCFKNCLTFNVFKCPAQSDKTIKSCSGCKHWKLKE